MLYWFLRLLCLVGLGQFFRRRTIIHRERAIESGPLLAVANHPNNLMDPLVVASIYRRRFWFMVKSTVFVFPFRTILRSLSLVPVYRPRDGSDPSKNDEMFSAVADRLIAGEAVMIFPEGTSLWQRMMLEAKTGFARLAFLAESRAGWKLGLQIQPNGLTYDDYSAFRGSVTAVVGEPIRVSAWKEMYLRDPRAAVKDLTAAVEARMRALTVEVRKEADVGLVEKLGRVYALAPLDDQSRMKQISDAVETLVPVKPQLREEVECRIDDYLDEASALGLVAGLERANVRHRWSIWLLSPLIVLGWLLNRIPYHVTTHLLRKVKYHPTYLGTMILTFGLISFLSWYVICFATGTLMSWLLGASIGWAFLWGAGFSALVALSGSLANRTWLKLKYLWYSSPFSSRRRQLAAFKKQGEQLANELQALAQEAAATPAPPAPPELPGAGGE